MPVVTRNPQVFPEDVKESFRVAGAPRIRCRISWLKGVLVPEGLPLKLENVRAGLFAKMDCPGCIEIWVVEDAELATDWEPAP